MREDRDPVLAEYAHLAHRYDSRWSAYLESSVRRTLVHLVANPGERVLDVGCGTGRLLLEASAAPDPPRCFGIDPSPEMIAVARTRTLGVQRLAIARGEQLPFSDDSFDWVVSTSVFHYLRDPRAALLECRRVLKQTGALVITDWCDDYLSCKVLSAAMRLLGRAHFRTYTRRQCEHLLRDARFTAIEIGRYRISWLWGLMTARAEKPAARDPGTGAR